jgi:hypothetical protein
MATELNIIDLDDALVIRAARKPPLAEGILSAVAAGAFAAILAFHFVGLPGGIVSALLAASLVLLYARRKRNVELRITRLEFVSRGRVGDNLGSTRTACSADIQWLEYQEDTTGPGTSHQPGGLYAVLGRRSICLLPDMNEPQTALVIERIEGRFPDFKSQWENKSVFGRNFTSLGLDEPR